MIFVKIPTMGDDSIQTQGYEDGTWFVADSFSFGVEREMKESSEKGGTQDINIGVGELQEWTISKSLDVASTPLLNLPSTATLWGLRRSTSWKSQAAPMGNRSVTSSTNWTRCFIRSWSTAGDADERPREAVAFYYNKIACQYTRTDHGKKQTESTKMTWDKAKNIPWRGLGKQR